MAPVDAGRTASDPPPSRLIVIGAAASVRLALRSRWDGAVVLAGANWDPQAPVDPAPGPQDVLLVWVTARASVDHARISALHAQHPRVPLLARVPSGSGERTLQLLGAGVQEVFSRAIDLATAVARARSRAGVSAEPRRRSGDDRSPASYDGLFQNLYDWIYVIGVAEDGRMTFETVNPPLHAASDFLNPDFSGRTPEDCLSAAGATLMRSHLEQVLAEGRPLQFEEEQPVGGRMRSFQSILTPVRNKWGRIHRVAGISRDTTALKEAQAALRASEERLAHALEGTQQGLWDWDVLNGVVYRSPRWFEMMGLAPGSVAETLDAGLERIHPDDAPGVEQAIRLHLDGHMPRFQAEYRVRTGNGDWLWLFDVGKAVAWAPDGRAARIAGLCTDITERRRAEESLRALVGGVVHEMRNPAFGIGVNLDALEATFGDEGRYRPFVAALRESCTRILNLMNDLRDYGEPRTLRAEPCRMRALVEEAARSCDALLRDGGNRLRLEFEDDQLILPVHAIRMHQVFRNLMENALLHAPTGTDVTVSSRTEHQDGQAWAVFTVEDAGPGFDPEALARAFEPFFTRRRGGTGLGLSIVRRVVEEHGGGVDAVNRDAGGARLTLRLPMPRTKAVAEAVDRG
jgi:PAS domain S-box-containing protein